MYFVDHLAYCSPLRKMNPNQKLIFSIANMVMVLLATGYILPVAVILLMTLITITKGKISVKNFGKILLLPALFLIMGIIPVMVGLEIEAGLKIYLTWEGFYRGIFLAVRALAAIICLYFFILTTPMVDTLQLLKKYRCPALIRELMFLIYRFIMILTEITMKIFLAQRCRGGYNTIRNSRQSLSRLVSSLFLGLYQRSEESQQGLVARGYNGEIDLLPLEYDPSPKVWLFIITTQAALLFLLTI